MSIQCSSMCSSICIPCGTHRRGPRLLHYREPAFSATQTVVSTLTAWPCSTKLITSFSPALARFIVRADSLCKTGINSVGYDPVLTKMSNWDQLRFSFRQLRASCMSHARNFGMFGLVYSAVECNVEKVGSRRDRLELSSWDFRTRAVESFVLST